MEGFLFQLFDLRVGVVIAFACKKRRMAVWSIGCSGFYYKHWKNIFYPNGLPMRKWFAFYNEHFTTLELNNTFYRFPRLENLATWYNDSGPDFIFSAKAPKAITHYKQFHQTRQMIADVYGTLKEGLKEKLGCVLFQLPPRLSFNSERLHRITESLDPAFNNVLECRHPSWWNEEAFRVLSTRNISFCGMSHPGLPEDIIQNTEEAYYRFHGVPALYSSPYSPGQLEDFAAAVNNLTGIKRGFVYFNNDIEGWAIHNAKQLRELLQPVG